MFSDDTTLKPNQRVTAIERCVLYTGSIFLQTSVVLKAPLSVVVVTDSESVLVVAADLLLTPHVAFFSQESTLELEERAAGEVASVLEGRMPDNLVNPNVLPHARAELTTG